MTTSMNLFLRLKELQPAPPVLTGTLDVDLGGGMARVAMASGGTLNARNPLKIAVGKSVFVQAGAITGEAPALTYLRIEI